MIPLCCENDQVVPEQNIVPSACAIMHGKEQQYGEINSKLTRKLCENKTNLIHAVPVKHNRGKGHYFCHVNWR